MENSDAQLLVRGFSIKDLQYLINVDPALLNELAVACERANDDEFLWLNNLALAVANLISKTSPEKAVALMQRAIASQAVVTQSLGDGLTFEHRAIYSSIQSEPLKALWRNRLLGVRNNTELAREVRGAERFGASEFLKDLILELSSSNSNLDQAFAISLAGFSVQTNELDRLITKHADAKSIVGRASREALISHKNAAFADYWTNKMWDAPKREEFWRCLMIAQTCMDARVSYKPKSGSKWVMYAPCFRKVRKRALEDRNKKRAKRLLGEEVPNIIFI